MRTLKLLRSLRLPLPQDTTRHNHNAARQEAPLSLAGSDPDRAQCEGPSSVAVTVLGLHAAANFTAMVPGTGV